MRLFLKEKLYKSSKDSKKIAKSRTFFRRKSKSDLNRQFWQFCIEFSWKFDNFQSEFLSNPSLKEKKPLSNWYQSEIAFSTKSRIFKPEFPFKFSKSQFFQTNRAFCIEALCFLCELSNRIAWNIPIRPTIAVNNASSAILRRIRHFN